MKRQNVRYKETSYSKLAGKDSDSGDETELFTRKAFTEIPTMEKVVQEGDTLQSISIRYHCTIAELKRLNKIHKENEIFARNTIKVPAKPFSMIIAGVHDSGSTSPNGRLQPAAFDQTLLHDKLTNIVPANDFNSVIFNSKVNKCDNESADSGDDEVRLLPGDNAVDKPRKTPWSCSGADADISWIALIVCIVVVIFAVPVIYVVYIAEHPEEYHHIKTHLNATT